MSVDISLNAFTLIHMKDIEDRMKVAIRTAIRKHSKAKLWAKVNHEDNFALAVLSTAEVAALNVIAYDDSKPVVDFCNKMFDTPRKWQRFLLTTCREMYSLLRI